MEQNYGAALDGHIRQSGAACNVKGGPHGVSKGTVRGELVPHECKKVSTKSVFCRCKP